MAWNARSSLGLLVVISVAAFGAAQSAQAAIETRETLKTYFQTGDVPTQEQFATLIDSAVHFVDDRNLIGLRVYDPAVSYLPGDTIIFERLAAGAAVGAIAEGT